MPNSDISGQITDGSGNPIGSAEVYLWREDLAGVGGVVASTTADANGNFSFTAHPDGSGSSESWHVAAKDPNANVQLQSAYGVTASLPAPTLTIDDFGSYSTGSLPSEYTAVNNGSPSAVTSSRAFSGSQSLKAEGDTGFYDLTPRVERTFSAITPSELQMVYQEDEDIRGISVQWYGSNGDELCSVGSANPPASVYNGSGTTLESSPSPKYGEWRRFTIAPDFANGTFDVLWEDLTGSTGDRTASGLSFNGSPTDVAKVTIGGDGRGPRMGDGGPGPGYIDDLGVFP